ncbi:SpaA isopeptide-forming pilin-related protein [Listeria costaricensis]|uniref:SpaA isopeptide-forming pilin-related protein n=1 Tax=Listeria costaricensis TaxID=2026604 RepID=UPI0013C5189C|nr:SpaA isopeptide-forming pilin-related protein [Listeria costaricensis]
MLDHAYKLDMPTGKFSIENKNQNASWNSSTGQQETPWYITDTDSTNAHFTLSLPSGVAAVTRDGKKHSGNVTLSANEDFKLVADASYDKIVKINVPTDIHEVTALKFTPNNSSSVQSLMKAGTAKDPISVQDLTAKFTAQKGKVNIVKTDSETGSKNQGESTFAGAQYKVTDSSNHSEIVTLDKNGKGSTPDASLLIGPIKTQEIKAPQGYNLNSKVYTSELKMNSDNKLVLTQNVSDDVIKGNIEIQKYWSPSGGSGELAGLAGAEFQLIDKDGKVVQTGTTDKNGALKFNDVVYGHYTIHESKTPEGVLPVPDFEVFVNEQGKIYHYNLFDDNLTGILKIVKVDKETGKTIPAANTTFKVKDLSTDKYVSIEGNTEFKTDDAGQVYVPVDLKAGHYQIEELTAPDGYVLSKDPVEFTVSNGTINDDGVVKVEFADKAQKGKINLTKTGEVATTATKSDSEYGDLYKFGFSQEALEGAEFDVIASEDIVTPDGTTRAHKGDTVDHIVTDSKGKASSDELYLGGYDLIETKAPAGYILPTKKIHVELTYAGQDVEVTSANAKAKNTWQELNTNIVKVAEQVDSWNADGTYNSSYQPTSGITFGIYTAEDYKVDNKVVVPKDSLIAISETGKDGIASSTVKVPNNMTFYAQELETTDQHVKNTDKIPLTYAADDNTNKQTIYVYADGMTLDKQSADLKPIENDLYTDDFTIMKFNEVATAQEGSYAYNDQTGVRTTGTTFELKNADGQVIDTMTIDETGQVTSPQLPVGDYTFQETMSADDDRLVVDPMIYTVKIRKSGVTILDDQGKVISKDGTAIVENDLYKNHFTLNKEMEVFDVQKGAFNYRYERGQLAEGTTFEVLNEKDELVDTMKVDKTGQVTSADLPVGTYKVFETIVSDDVYKLNEQVFTVTITKQDVLITDVNNQVVGHDEFTVRNDLIKQDFDVEKQVEILDKQDADGFDSNYESGKAAQGYEFTLYDATGNVAMKEVTDAFGKAHFEAIPCGKYTLKETALGNNDYRLNETTYEVDVTPTKVIIRDEKGQVVNDQHDLIVKNDLKKGTVDFTKTDAATSEELEGAEINIKGEDTDFTFTSKKEPTRFALKDGTYELTETKAPAGYIKSDEKITVVVKDQQITKCVLKNEAKPLPKTGDDSAPGWMYLIAGVLVGAAGMYLFKQPSRKKKNK